ncbi:MAG TPA: adenylate/guanylate cyclase domain-containing protein [Gemmataceae bacterium]|nr:adenylate/guanylate cyclase domain-containing protein [Gemmataceae bacterium]
MRLPFRYAVLAVLLGLLGATVLLLGISSYANARFTAKDLSDQILEQTTARVDQQIAEILSEALEHGPLSKGLFMTDWLRTDDFPSLVGFWSQVIEVNPELTGLFLGVEATGESVGVSRLTPTGLSVWESKRNQATGRLEEREFHLREYPHKPYASHANKSGADVRQRPWYAAARAANAPIWTDTYTFVGFEGVRGDHGVTYATPVYRDEKLVAVVAADFHLRGLCGFLKTLKVGRNGYAFVLEVRQDGSRWVIAHPNANLLTREVRQADNHSSVELIPIQEVDDAALQAFTARLPQVLPRQAQESPTPVSFRAKGVSYFGGYRRLGGDQNPGWLICTVIPEADVMERVHENGRHTLAVGVLILIVAVVIGLYGSSQVARPLERLAQEADAIGHLRLEARPAARSLVREVDRLVRAFEEMKTGLRSFQKYVPADLVRSLLASNREASLGGERRTVTVLFCDIADFTATAETMTPEELIEHLRAYLSALSREIIDTGGTVDKYIGDAIMAFWGAPAPDAQHAAAACAAALRCQATLRKLQQLWQAQGKPLFTARIGLNTGDVVVGNVGSETRLNYTVIGDAVNLASRLEGLNKVYGTEIIVSETTYQQAGPAIVARPLDWVLVKGKTAPVLIYEVLGLKEELDAAALELASLCGDALAAYRQRDWRKAASLFTQVLQFRPDDAPARLMAARCSSFLSQPPGDDWDGVYRLKEK